MLSDLDWEMTKRKLRGIVVFGDTTLGNPDLAYVVGGSLARGAVFVKGVGKDPILATSNLDAGTARRLGRAKKVSTYSEWGLEKIAVRYGRERAQPHLIASILRAEGIRGRISVSGRNDLASGTRLIDELRKLGAKIIGEATPTVLESVRETKSQQEIEEIRNVGAKTATVVESVVKSLRNMKRKRGRLYLEGAVATIGSVKKAISSLLAEQDLIAPEGTIFAIGASSADPHNPGTAVDKVREGRLIVFDIFTQDQSGYWFDLTRSFVIGRADAKARKMFETVNEAQDACMDVIREGVSGEAAMLEACRVIERAGYRTVREVFDGRSKSISSGFSHSLGHGVGLTIGERPYLTFLSKDPLRSRQVVTVEPGVYVPRLGGVRIEDTVAIRERGVEPLASVDKELEIT